MSAIEAENDENNKFHSSALLGKMDKVCENVLMIIFEMCIRWRKLEKWRESRW